MTKDFDTPYHYASPIGTIAIYASATALVRLEFSTEPASAHATSHPVIQHCTIQLDEYFSGQRTLFDLPLKIQVSALQQRIYSMMSTIPYGNTYSYGQIATSLGNIGLSRMVGYACHHNPFLIIIPCHRVVGKNKELTGYRGGLDKKFWLLNLESQHACLPAL